MVRMYPWGGGRGVSHHPRFLFLLLWEHKWTRPGLLDKRWSLGIRIWVRPLETETNSPQKQAQHWLGEWHHSGRNSREITDRHGPATRAWEMQRRLSYRRLWPHMLLPAVIEKHPETPSTPQEWMLRLFHTGCPGYLPGTTSEDHIPKESQKSLFKSPERGWRSGGDTIWKFFCCCLRTSQTNNQLHVRDWQTFLAKEQTVNILGFALSAATTQLWDCSTKAATGNT